MGKLLLTFVLVVLPISAWPYDPETGHIPLLATSIGIYEQCVPKRKAELERYKQDIIAGDAMMDEGRHKAGKKLFPWWHALFVKDADIFDVSERVFNWHFYNPGRESLADIGFIDQSMVGLFAKAGHGFLHNKSKSDKVFFLGALSHLTEDLTVPAHVLPVYHGPVSAELLSHGHIRPVVGYMKEHFAHLDNNPLSPLMIKDPIDEAPVNTSGLPRQVEAFLYMQGTKTCDYIQEMPIKSLDDFRDEVANRTLDCLGTTTIDGCPGMTWSDFWVKPTGNEYFGKYNIADGNPLILQPGKLVAHGKSCKFVGDGEKIDPRYQGLVNQLHVFAVLDDLRLIHWGLMSY